MTYELNDLIAKEIELIDGLHNKTNIEKIDMLVEKTRDIIHHNDYVYDTFENLINSKTKDKNND